MFSNSSQLQEKTVYIRPILLSQKKNIHFFIYCIQSSKQI